MKGAEAMAWSFSAHRPVYYQVAERIKHSILSGEYSRGEQIPSVRQLALEAAVNPNTIQHAFSHLENEGLIISRGTVGRFVTDDPEVIEKCRHDEALLLISEFTEKAAKLHISRQTLAEMINSDTSVERKV